MPQWVRTDVELGIPDVLLTISQRETVVRLGIDLRKLLAEGPEVIAAVISDLIEEHRPELAGGILFGIEYRGGMVWEFWYMHRSLSRRRQSEEVPRMPLLPAQQLAELEQAEAGQIPLPVVQPSSEDIKRALHRVGRRIMGRTDASDKASP